MKYIALLFSDSHLKDRRGDEYYALEQIVNAAIKHKVGVVIGAGDLLDKQSNRSKSIKIFQNHIQCLLSNGIEFAFVQGNHDSDDPPWLSSPGIHLHGSQMGLGLYSATGLDYQPYGKLQEALSKIPKDVNLLVLHQSFEEWMGDITVPQGSFRDIPSHVKIVFTGDLHKCIIERNKNIDGEKILTISSGATCQQKINEPYEHFYFLMDDEGKFTKHKLKSRVFIDWPVLNHKECLDKLMSEIEAELSSAWQHAAANDYPDEVSKPYLRVTYSHKLHEAVRRITKAVNGRAIHYWKEIPPEEKTKILVKSVSKGGKALTPLSVLPDVVDASKEPEVFELVNRLLSSNNPELEFATWRKEQLSEET